MQTVKQIERLWDQGRYVQLFEQLTRARAEAAFGAHLLAGSPALAAAAMAIVRLDELGMASAPVSDKLIRCLIAAQESDGGWGEPMLTALCLRALLVNRGAGVAVEAALGYLTTLQHDNGIWPRVPLRRFPGDAMVSIFILNQLAHEARFREAIDFDAATDWFASHTTVLDAQTRSLWERVSLRSCRWQSRATGDSNRLVTLWT